MRKYFVLPLISLLLVFHPGKAQQKAEFSVSDMPGSEITDFKRFTGSNLWGHINGGADLFLEYGFKDLLYYEISIQSQRFYLEIYQFENPNQALGMFSIKKYGCKNTESFLTGLHCATNLSLIFPTGNYFISIAHEHASAEEKANAYTLAKTLKTKIGADDLRATEILPPAQDGYEFEDFKLLMGPLGFQNGLPEWESFFLDGKGYTCLYYHVFKNGQEIDAFLLAFEEEEEINRFVDAKSWQFNEKDFEQEGETNLIVAREEKVLIILSGKVPMEILRSFRNL